MNPARELKKIAVEIEESMKQSREDEFTHMAATTREMTIRGTERDIKVIEDALKLADYFEFARESMGQHFEKSKDFWEVGDTFKITGIDPAERDPMQSKLLIEWDQKPGPNDLDVWWLHALMKWGQAVTAEKGQSEVTLQVLSKLQQVADRAPKET